MISGLSEDPPPSVAVSASAKEECLLWCYLSYSGLLFTSCFYARTYFKTNVVHPVVSLYALMVFQIFNLVNSSPEFTSYWCLYSHICLLLLSPTCFNTKHTYIHSEPTLPLQLVNIYHPLHDLKTLQLPNSAGPRELGERDVLFLGVKMEKLHVLP